MDVFEEEKEDSADVDSLNQITVESPKAPSIKIIKSTQILLS